MNDLAPLSVETKNPPSARPARPCAVGLDIGHSAVKICWQQTSQVEKSIFPSAVSPAVVLSDYETARRAAGETVSISGTNYFYGETAVVQAGQSAPTGLVANWVKTNEYKVLCAAVADRLERAGVSLKNAVVVCGLPSSQVQSQSDGLRELMLAIFPHAEIKIFPQPMGAYAYHRFNERGLPSKNIGEGEAWGVIDVGRYSTDYLLVIAGNVVERVSNSSSGTRVVADFLREVLRRTRQIDDVTPQECEEIIATGSLMSFGKRISVSREIDEAVGLASGELIDAASRLLGQDARRMSGLVVAGGGATLFHSRIKAMFPHAILCPEPRYAVAEGFRRIGAGILYARSLN